MRAEEVDWSLYLVADPDACAGRPVAHIVRAALRGGATVVQLRNKTGSAREVLAQAFSIKELMANTGIPFIVNDRADVAAAAGADGVHLGQSDLPVQAARRVLGPDAIVGLSVDSVEEALEGHEAGADYLGVGPVYPTDTKTDTGPEWGPEGLERLRERCPLPFVGIGGIDASNAAAVVRAGADGVAVVSAVCSAHDPHIAARRVRHAVAEGRR